MSKAKTTYCIKQSYQENRIVISGKVFVGATATAAEKTQRRPH